MAFAPLSFTRCRRTQRNARPHGRCVYKHTRLVSLRKHLCTNEVGKRFKSRGGAPSLPNRSSIEANGAS